MTEQSVLILDGGMGRELNRRGAPFRQPEWSALAMIETPEIVKTVHQDYIQSGAQVITTNSYSLVPFHIGDKRFTEQALALAERSGQVARDAAQGTEAKVAGSLPPLFGSYRPDLYDAEHVRDIATPLIEGLKTPIDFWLAETQSLIAESLALKGLVKELTDDEKPFWVSFTLEDSEPTSEPCLRSGESVQEAVNTMAKAGVSAILFNCCQPEVIEQALIVAADTLKKLNLTEIRLGAYANAFPPQPKDATANDGLDELRADLTPESYIPWADKWRACGASVIGGCCGIGPEHIAKLSDHFKARD
ncbi:homocysteine S-methyltransferase family protein [Celerinatantimonas diazotrophica]|uniref:Homocysteine S-methyltransferase n=1 Tax=Celerinatantimonas diazotrophica TaxID=412034 RepID=A0A4R1K258_9GAMM|nr:homocysteine S-methyltransferase family protein [Celerinatantimonas diazotrophica]TCK58104.1 homocysteine S-methyltransferase [Celerinatantimonas diazotrophica]CAG9297824.1 Homocysteine S-methyltransferase [Celerinatantimonas diazotrophica]